VLNRRRFCSLALSPLVVRAASVDPDWPQWQGPDRTGISKETGLLKSWPSAGPPQLWAIKGLGEGYGSLAILRDRIFVQGVQNGSSSVFCLNRADGKTVWVVPMSTRLDQDRGAGPRGTPTLDGDVLYALSDNGELVCLLQKDGAKVWRRNILQEFSGHNPHWLISESPLVDGGHLIVMPGGDNAGMVALDKTNGKTVWASKELSDQAAYSSCVVADIDGVRTIIGFTSKAGVGVRASDGKLMWHYTKVSNRTANIATPIVSGNKVFYTSAYGTGAALLSLKAENGEVKADEVYFTNEMMNHHGGVVLVNGYLYGYSNAILTCMEFNTGKVAWKDRSVGKGTVTYADGMLYLLGEKNVMGLADATPEGYHEKGRFTIEDSGFPSWSHPVICGGKLYIRNQTMLMCYNVKA